MATNEFLAGAAGIGRRLAATAVWHGGRCTWVAPKADDRPVYAALAGDLYDGTAGIALFLAEASSCLGEPELATLARGAIRHAVSREWASAGGLYTGQLSVAVAAARVATVLGDPSLAPDPPLRAPAGDADLAGGDAGALVALLALGRVPAAVACGERLLERAERRPHGWSWPGPGRRGLLNLTGYFHGTAGIGLALRELAAASGDERFAAAAGQARAYEQHWRARCGGAWPDLRWIGRRVASDAPLPVSESWCHGAPGVLLARVRQAELSGRDDPDVAHAAEMTRAIAARWAADGAPDPCLCHGAAGLGDILRCTGDGSELPERLGEALLAGELPEHPGLFTGAAGVGLFYLRLVDRSIPTPLAIHPCEQVDPTGHRPYISPDQQQRGGGYGRRRSRSR